MLAWAAKAFQESSSMGKQWSVMVILLQGGTMPIILLVLA
jgi:hypothetical protein